MHNPALGGQKKSWMSRACWEFLIHCRHEKAKRPPQNRKKDRLLQKGRYNYGVSRSAWNLGLAVYFVITK